MKYSRPLTGFEALIGYSPDAEVRVPSEVPALPLVRDVTEKEPLSERSAVLSREGIRLLEERQMMGEVIHVEFSKDKKKSDSPVCFQCQSPLPTFDGAMAIPPHPGVTLVNIIFRVKCDRCETVWDLEKTCR